MDAESDAVIRLHSGRALTISDYILEVQMNKDREQRQAERQARAGEAATKPRVDAPPHDHVSPTFNTTPLPPQSDELKAGQAFCGRAVRVLADAEMRTVYLDHFDINSNTYNGHYYTGKVIVVLAQPGSTTLTGPQRIAETLPVTGLRPYPQPARGDGELAFEWLYPGQDEAILINIANASIAAREPESGASE